MLAVGLWLAPTACRSAEERAQATEAATLSSAIQLLRAAPNAQKQGPLATLRALPCHYPRACETQQLCVQAYALHTKALETSALVREGTRRGDPTTEGAAAALLTGVEKDLELAKRLMEQCLELETTLLVEARP